MLGLRTLSAAAVGAALVTGGAVYAVEAPNCGTLTAPVPCLASAPTSTGGVVPYIIPGANRGGNRTCGEVGFSYFGNAAYYQCFSDRSNFDKATNTFDKTFADISGNANCDRNTVGITVTTDDTYVTFSATPDGLGALIVKGSDDANTYVYEPQRPSDSGLAAPVNASGAPAALSNLTVCWNPLHVVEPCLQNETAWAAGGRYVSRGNWATYTPYSGAAKSVTLYAGRTMNAGTVAFSAPAAGVVAITVTLNSGWQFSSLPGETDGTFDNNLKVQDYATAPSGNPAPGLFQWKRVCDGNACTIEVPLNNYYGVHVDVAKEIPCPE